MRDAVQVEATGVIVRAPEDDVAGLQRVTGVRRYSYTHECGASGIMQTFM